MTERSILFNSPMVRAAMAELKTQTRRIMRNQVCEPGIVRMAGPGRCEIVNAHGVSIPGWRCPYGQPGDLLWVRESYRVATSNDCRCHGQCGACVSGEPIYAADYANPSKHGPWRPSIHMPRRASRICLEITDVRVERLNDISDAGAQAEGVEGHYVEDGWYWRNYLLSDADAAVSPMLTSAKDSFRTLWESINGFGSWAANPWVWVVEFRRIEP